MQLHQSPPEFVGRRLVLPGVKGADRRLGYVALGRDFGLRHPPLRNQLSDELRPVNHGNSKHRIADSVPNGFPIVNIGKLLAVEKERSPFGQRMYDARTKAKLTQHQVCIKLKIAQSTLSELERGAAGSSRTVAFATLYGCSAQWLADGAGQADVPADRGLSAAALAIAAHYDKSTPKEQAMIARALAVDIDLTQPELPFGGGQNTFYGDDDIDSSKKDAQ